MSKTKAWAARVGLMRGNHAVDEITVSSILAKSESKASHIAWRQGKIYIDQHFSNQGLTPLVLKVSPDIREAGEGKSVEETPTEKPRIKLPIKAVEASPKQVHTNVTSFITFDCDTSALGDEHLLIVVESTKGES